MEKTEKAVLEAAGEYLIPVPLRLPVIVKGEGVMVEDINGKKYLDFATGPGVLPVGHCHPEIVEVARKQFGVLNQCPGNALNIQVVELAKKLAQIAPKGLKRTFFCNSGAEAVDAAVKLAKKHAAKEGRVAMGIVALEHGFHGRLSLSFLDRHDQPEKGIQCLCIRSWCSPHYGPLLLSLSIDVSFLRPLLCPEFGEVFPYPGTCRWGRCVHM